MDNHRKLSVSDSQSDAAMCKTIKCESSQKLDVELGADKQLTDDTNTKEINGEIRENEICNTLKADLMQSNDKVDDFDGKSEIEPTESPRKVKLNDRSNVSNTPNLPNSLYTTLPDFIKRVVAHADGDDERDILLLGSLVATGSCLTKLHGVYDEMTLYPNLYLFLTADASAGKGRIGFCRKLVEPIHNQLREKSKKEKEEFGQVNYSIGKNKKDKNEDNAAPKERMLFIPANSSSTSVYQILAENDSKGLIFETEGDVLSNAFKSDHGDYSTGFRQAFHHETISYHRRTNNEYKEIVEPKLSAILAGTPNQVQTLIPNAENGLFSRFIFYKLSLTTDWKNVFANKVRGGLESHFNSLGSEFLEMYTELEEADDISFDFTEKQKDQFHEFFASLSKKHTTLHGLDFLSITRRTGVIFFRIAMIISFFRMKEQQKSLDQIVCEDVDFNITKKIVEVLILHSGFVFSQTPKKPKSNIVKTREQQILESLPLKFNRKILYDVSSKLNIPKKSADKLITKLTEDHWVQKEMHNSYINTTKLDITK